VISGAGCCGNTIIKNNKAAQRLRASFLIVLFFVSSLFSSICATAADSQPATGENFDHLETGFPLEGRHNDLDCEQCHVGGLFEELPVQCEKCHDGVFAVGKPLDHIQTSASCDSCHTPVGFALAATQIFDHSAVGAKPCKDCHNGVNATGQSPNHIFIGPLDCNECHNINTWQLDAFDHTKVEQTKTTCNGVGCHDASRKPASHPLTTNRCIACHTYLGWLVDVNVDHGEILGSCASSRCHDGSGKGKSKLSANPPHPPTTDVCEACHNKDLPDWLPLQQMDHSQITTNNCLTSRCHTPADKQGNHPPTSDVCEACHMAGQWLPVITPFDHDQVNSGASCVTSGCHSPTDKGSNHPPTTDRCEACHMAGQWMPVITPFDHNEVTNPTCEAAGCHDASDKSATHPITPDNCSYCHKTLGSWLPASFDHSGVITSCSISGCHDGHSTATYKSSTHPPTTDDCVQCHTFPDWLALNSPFEHSGVLTPTCLGAGCHSVADKGPTHPPVTTDTCETCHSSSDNTWTQINTPFDHNLTTAPTCNIAGCHTASD
jgi:hypothetical protein